MATLPIRPAPMGIRAEVTAWKYGPDCEFCGEVIPPGEPGVYAERSVDPTQDDGDYEQNYAWHLDCAQAFGKLLLTVVDDARGHGLMPADDR